jgi:deazaflavin-dependent oxidoreductase (nitroreductase family)
VNPLERIFRSVRSGRMRNRLGRQRRLSTATTRLHARFIERSGGRLRRSFLFVGGMPVLVLTTTGRKSGKRRSTPLGYLRDGERFAVLAANAGNDAPPAWWLNLQNEPNAEVTANGRTHPVRARRAPAEDERRLWARFAELNPAFGEYRNLTERQIPVVLLEPR